MKKCQFDIELWRETIPLNLIYFCINQNHTLQRLDESYHRLIQVNLQLREAIPREKYSFF